VKDESTSSSLSTNFKSNSANVGSNFNNGRSPGPLAGLFADGMPKLKPTGLRANMIEQEEQNVNNSNCPPAIRKPSRKKHPPPPPPIAQKPQIYNQVCIQTSII